MWPVSLTSRLQAASARLKLPVSGAAAANHKLTGYLMACFTYSRPPAPHIRPRSQHDILSFTIPLLTLLIMGSE